MLAWSRAYRKAKENKNVLLYTIYKLHGRDDDFQWICPLIETKATHLYSLVSRSDLQIKQIDDAKSYRVGVFGRGWAYDFMKLQGFQEGVNLDTTFDEQANIRKLMKGRVDFIVQESGLIEQRLKKEGISPQKVKPVHSLVDSSHQKGCMAMSRDTSVEMIDKLQRALDKVIQM